MPDTEAPIEPDEPVVEEYVEPPFDLDAEPAETVTYTDTPDIGPPPRTWEGDDETGEWVDTPAVVEVDPGTPAGEDRLAAVENALEVIAFDLLMGGGN